MLTITINRSDLYPFCRKMSMELLTLREVDEQKVTGRNFFMADLVYFIDDDGSTKVLKSKKKPKK